VQISDYVTETAYIPIRQISALSGQLVDGSQDEFFDGHEEWLLREIALELDLTYINEYGLHPDLKIKFSAFRVGPRVYRWTDQED
jgi:hypothetical protein